MKPSLEEHLVKEFPHLYADYNGDMRQTCMTWGFDHGDGWFDIIHDLSDNLTILINRLPLEERKHVRASQVKEKYGTLRFYMTSETVEMAEAIQEAERLSAKTCELCGNPGRINKNGWLSVRCSSCRAKEKQHGNA